MTTLQPIRDAISIKSTERAAAWQAARAASAHAEQLTREITELQVALKEGRHYELAVTEHALLRFAERVLGMDPAEVVAQIRAQVGAKAVLLGDGKYPMGNGFHAVVKSKTVVTIEPA